MRSPVATLVLAVIAAAVVALAGMSLSDGNLDRLLGGRPAAEGQHLYQFDPAEVNTINLKGPGVDARFQLIDGQWRATSPWNDRMDPRNAVSLISFTLNTTVEEAIPRDKVDARLVGLETGNIIVQLDDAGGEILARYVLGRRTAWYAEGEEGEDPIPTVFLRPLERARRDHVYACTFDPHPILGDGFRMMRDHRPFLFHPDGLTGVRIRTTEGELKLARKNPMQPWRIVKPLELPTEKDAVRRLIEGLYELSADKISDPTEATTGDDAAAKRIEIGIESVVFPDETLLQVELPADPAARTAPATISDRQAVFDLPLRTEAGKVALLELPLTVNDLRDKTLTRLHGPSLKSIVIDTSGGSPIVLARAARSRWKLLGQGSTEEIDERSLLKLIQAVTEDKVTRFITDAAADLSPWGLDQPTLKLRFSAFDGQALELCFSRNEEGEIHVNRTGSPTVVRIDESTLLRIATRRYQWKSPSLWNLSRVDIKSILRESSGKPPLALRYTWGIEKWNARRDGADVSADLNPNRADYLLSKLEQLQVLRWLDPSNSAAAAALLQPKLRLTVTARVVNDLGDETGERQRSLSVSPVSDSAENQFYYGRLDGVPFFFMLDQQTFDDLSVELFEEE